MTEPWHSPKGFPGFNECTIKDGFYRKLIKLTLRERIREWLRPTINYELLLAPPRGYRHETDGEFRIRIKKQLK